MSYNIYDDKSELISLVDTEAGLPELLPAGYSIICTWEIHNPIYALEISIQLGKAKAELTRCGEMKSTLHVRIITFNTSDMLALVSYVNTMFKSKVG